MVLAKSIAFYAEMSQPNHTTISYYIEVAC